MSTFWFENYGVLIDYLERIDNYAIEFKLSLKKNKKLFMVQCDSMETFMYKNMFIVLRVYRDRVKWEPGYFGNYY